MNFQPLPIIGAFLITLEKKNDQRGSFTRTFCTEEFKKNNLCSDFKQDSMSWNIKKGTIRGMHYQYPNEEIKIVQCLKGKIFDTIIDLRKNSPTFEQHFSIELSEKNQELLYIPSGCAHGFQTLQNNTVLFYKISEFFIPQQAKGILWNDSYFSIKWPLPLTSLSEKDCSYAPYKK